MVNTINPQAQTPIATVAKLSGEARTEAPGAHLLEGPKDKAEIQGELDKVKKTNKDLKSYFAANTVMESVVKGFAAMGGFWGTITCIMGGAPGGMVGVWAGASSAFNVADGAGLANYSAKNRYKAGAIMGTLQSAQGLSLMVASMGFPVVGRYAAIASAACFAGRMIYSVYNSIAAGKEEDGAAARNQKKLEEKDILARVANKVAGAVKGGSEGVPKTLPSQA